MGDAYRDPNPGLVETLRDEIVDLGEVPAATVHDFAPSNRAVRERWNDAHPEAKVDAGGAKGGRK